MIVIPDAMRLAVVQAFGEPGQRWLDELPAQLDMLVSDWQLEPGEPLGNGLPINLVVAADRGGKPSVLKIGYPGVETLAEMDVLGLWRGRPDCVQLIDHQPSAGVMLLERILPGDDFRTAGLATATDQVKQLIRAMPIRVESPDQFPAYVDWCEQAFRRYRDHHDDWFNPYIEVAGRLVRELTAAYDADWLLHGDLHHENMLLNEYGDYVVIDPKGCIGPRVLEYGRFIHNFYVDHQEVMSAEQFLQERISSLVGEFSAQELRAAGFVDLVLSSCWTRSGGLELPAGNRTLLQQLAELLD